MTSFQSSELTELPVVENGQLFAQRVHSARTAHGTPPVLPHGTYHGTHVADISQPCPSKHDNTKRFSSFAQHRYHSVACILNNRHRIEPLANLAPHVEELDRLEGAN